MRSVAVNKSDRLSHVADNDIVMKVPSTYKDAAKLFLFGLIDSSWLVDILTKDGTLYSYHSILDVASSYVIISPDFDTATQYSVEMNDISEVAISPGLTGVGKEWTLKS